MARSSFYCKSRVSTERVLMKQRIIKLSEAHPRYGYRRIGALLRREDQRVNTKRVQRIRRQEGLQVRKKQRASCRVGISTATRQRARASQSGLELGHHSGSDPGGKLSAYLDSHR